jgi:GNAT superfamily N-acetyltransferase
MIRRARPEDADAITETFIASFETLLTFLPNLHTHAEHRRFITEIVPRDHEVWVAEEDGRVVGLAAIGTDTLGHLYVHPSRQGRGIGSALLDKTKELRPDGFTLWTFPANEGACRFYERHGLRPIEYGDGSGNEEGVPDVRYAWLPGGE